MTHALVKLETMCWDPCARWDLQDGTHIFIFLAVLERGVVTYTCPWSGPNSDARGGTNAGAAHVPAPCTRQHSLCACACVWAIQNNA